MRTFNKIWTVIGLVLAFVLLPVVAGIPNELVGFVREATFSIESWLAPGSRLILTVLAVFTWAGTVVLLYLEFRPARSTGIKVAAVEGGEATVAADSVARRLEQRLGALAGVSSARARVDQVRDGVVAQATLITSAEVNVPEITGQAISETRYMLENQVGAKVSQVAVRVQHAETPKRAQAPTARPEKRAAVTSAPAEVAWPIAPTEPAWAAPSEAPAAAVEAVTSQPASVIPSTSPAGPALDEVQLPEASEAPAPDYVVPTDELAADDDDVDRPVGQA